MADHLSTFRLGKDGPEFTVVLKDDLVPEQKNSGLYNVHTDLTKLLVTVTSTDKVATNSAAVNGIQNNLDRAAIVMLDKEAAVADLRRGKLPTDFTLYHVPKRGFLHDIGLALVEKIGFTTKDARGLLDAVKERSKSGEVTVWALHSRGASVFDAAIRQGNREGFHFENQSAAVFSGASNDFSMQDNLRKGGVSLVGKGFYNHPFDLVPQLVGLNTLDPVKIVGSLLNTPGLLTENSVHTWHPELKPSDFAQVPKAQWELPGVDLRADSSVSPDFTRGLLSENPSEALRHVQELAAAGDASVAPAQRAVGPTNAAHSEAEPTKPAADLLPTERVFPVPAPSLGRGPKL